MAEVFVGIGSNLGDKRSNLRLAAQQLESIGEIAKVSSLYRTEPVGFADQDWFLNAVLHVRTGCAPREFLDGLIEIERKLGRVRTVRNGPRQIDLDILLWDDLVLEEPGLSIPHPRLHERLFVLAPLAEIAPDWQHPILGERISTLREQLKQSPAVERLEEAFPFPV